MHTLTVDAVDSLRLAYDTPRCAPDWIERVLFAACSVVEEIGLFLDRVEGVSAVPLNPYSGGDARVRLEVVYPKPWYRPGRYDRIGHTREVDLTLELGAEDPIATVVRRLESELRLLLDR